MSWAYYNEHDPFAAAWLRELILEGHIAAGEVDERSIEDVKPSELIGFTQCHFFAGIGGWSHALRLAGWEDSRPVWTGSCPCQSFSAAGKRKGVDDKRHLWPAWFHLIEQCKPAIVFGEQVDAAIKHGWLDLVQTDMEAINYTVGHSILPAASVGAPHGRHRLFFVADATSVRRERLQENSGSTKKSNGGTTDSRTQWRSPTEFKGACATSSMADSHKSSDYERSSSGQQSIHSINKRGSGGMAVAYDDGREQRSETASIARYGHSLDSANRPIGFWANADWIPCRDGKWRPIEPGVFPLAHGVPNRMGLLRGYGNAIVPQVAQAFIEAFMSINNAS